MNNNMQTIYINNNRKRKLGVMSDILKKALIIGLGIAFAIILIKFLFSVGVIILGIAAIVYLISLFRR
jgi:hypothetical protein